MPTLKIHDPLYGQVRLRQPVLIELIHSPSVQRLKRLNQFGIPAEYYPYPTQLSRFDHSVGTCLLLRQLGASLEEQIAGLLHDVSHRAFSHVYDWVVATRQSEAEICNQQDIAHRQYLFRTELPQILRAHGVDPEKIVHLANYPLLDQPSPQLCADRIDYSLRELSPAAARAILGQLIVINGRIVCRSVTMAQQFAQAYLDLQQQRWSRPEFLGRYQILAQTLLLALEHGEITEEDFWLDDTTVIQKISHSTNEQIQLNLHQLRQPLLTKIPTHPHNKFRYVDPEVMFGRATKRLSDIHHGFALQIASAKAADIQQHQAVPA